MHLGVYHSTALNQSVGACYFCASFQVALRSLPDTLAIQNDGDEMLLQATAAHLKVVVSLHCRPGAFVASCALLTDVRTSSVCSPCTTDV